MLSILGFGSLVYASSHFSTLPLWAFISLLVAAIGIIALFVKRQSNLNTPLLDLSALNTAQFRYTMIIFANAYFLFLGLELLMPMYAQQVLLFSGTIAGLILFPASVVEVVALPIFGALLDKKGGRVVALPGAILMTFAVVALWFYASIESQAMVLAVLFCDRQCDFRRNRRAKCPFQSSSSARHCDFKHYRPNCWSISAFLSALPTWARAFLAKLSQRLPCLTESILPLVVRLVFR